MLGFIGNKTIVSPFYAMGQVATLFYFFFFFFNVYFNFVDIFLRFVVVADATEEEEILLKEYA